MKILKSNSPDKKKVSFKEIIEKIGKKNLIIAGSVLVIGLVVYLNWFLFSDPAVLPTDKTPAPPSATELGEGGAEDEANYFAVSLINRNRARDEAMEVLQTVVDAGASDDATKSALADISRIAADIEREANIESLVKSKGFENCVAVISGDSVNIVVKSDELLPNEIAQIKEIAYENAKILPENVVIISK